MSEVPSAPVLPGSQDKNEELNLSPDNFQKFMYDLFEGNGILNDLRAYLRGHIVNVLRSSQSGETSACQRRFTQRLELIYQALNILVAEYLLCLEFSYSLSVFVSEIPLANMVFEFSKSLINSDSGFSEGLRFNENDVWSILKYLGVKCDSDHATNILKMYNTGSNSPLLLCILTNIPMYSTETVTLQQEKTQEDLTSSGSSSQLVDPKPGTNRKSRERCKHIVACKQCCGRLLRYKEKYAAEKEKLYQNIIKFPDSPKEQSFMNTMNVLERDLNVEMFKNLQSVYEAELDQVKSEEQRRTRRSAVLQALQLRQKKTELERTFRAREQELEDAVLQKKRFLWGLASSLRDQHAAVARALRALHVETKRLSDKEKNLNVQVQEAEESLKRRAEQLHLQIVSEMAILEKQLEIMTKEKDRIQKEKCELEVMKVALEKQKPNEELSMKYELLSKELLELKTCMKSSQNSKCFMERSTLTELCGVTSRLSIALNNECGVAKEDDRVARTPNQVVNDIKKPKNVNFSLCDASRGRASTYSQSPASNGHERVGSRESDRSGDRSRGHGPEHSPQNTHQSCMECMSEHQARLGAQLAAVMRPSTRTGHDSESPTMCPATLGWLKGAGEELTLYCSAVPRILVPGDTLPFIGPLPDRHDRRHALPASQRRRLSPSNAAAKCVPGEVTNPPATERSSHSIVRESRSASPASIVDVTPAEENNPQLPPAGRSRVDLPSEELPRPSSERNKRERSPKSLLQEAKQKLKNKHHVRDRELREKSPTCVLREAKLRLRKLEIEAEAVERSYRDFRRRSEQTPDDHGAQQRTADFPKALKKVQASTERSTSSKIENYLRSYFQQTNNSRPPKPIPAAYYQNKPPEQNQRINYIETPLQEFRKLYNTKKSKQFTITEKNPTPTLVSPDQRSESPTMIEAIKEAAMKNNDKVEEIEILQKNLDKIYNIEQPPNTEIPTLTSAENTEVSPEKDQKDNLIIVVEESVDEVNNLKVSHDEREELFLMVQSSVEIAQSEKDEREPLSTDMTILVSPKDNSDNCNSEGHRSKRSLSPEQEAHLTRNDVFDAIFYTKSDIEEDPSVQFDLKDGTIDSVSEVDRAHGDGEEYPDDFSADVDNLNSQSELGSPTSPVSFAKTSDNEQLW